MSNITIFDHPLIQHKTTVLRQKTTTNKEFRELVEEITMLMCFEALRDLPLEDVEIETPIQKTTQKMIKGKKTGSCSHSPCRFRHGKRSFAVGSLRQGWTHRYVSG